MNQPVTLDLQSVQGTMLLPLWGRARYSAKYSEILEDKAAAEIVNNLPFDFSKIEKSFGEFSGICYLIRARKLEDTVRHFIKDHPRATIVNIGAGLDTGFSRVDNGSIHWYNLDLPDSIAFRKTLLPDTERNTSIAKSFFDTSWFDDIVFQPEDGILFLSGGVFYYFEEEQIKQIVTAIAQRFPGAAVCFDAESKSAVEKSNQMVKKTGNKGAPMIFYVNNAEQIQSWSSLVEKVTIEPYFYGVPQNKFGFLLRMQMAIMDRFGMMKFVHIKFR